MQSANSDVTNNYLDTLLKKVSNMLTDYLMPQTCSLTRQYHRGILRHSGDLSPPVPRVGSNGPLKPSRVPTIAKGDSRQRPLVVKRYVSDDHDYGDISAWPALGDQEIGKFRHPTNVY